MIYWRLLLLALFVVLVCLLNLPHQISRIEYSLSHNRTRMLELDLLEAKKSLASVEKPPYSSRYPEALDRLGWIYYQLSDVARAESTFVKEYDVCGSHIARDFDPVYEKSLLSLATFYRERANYGRAEHFYILVREYDLSHTRAQDPRRARDLANLGLLYYLWAETNPDLVKRSDMLCRAQSFCETAMTQYEKLPGYERAQGNIYATEALVLRDLGLPAKAQTAGKRSREILANAANKAVEP